MATIIKTSDSETFEFSMEGSDTVWSLPLLADLPVDEMNRLADVVKLDKAAQGLAVVQFMAGVLDRHCAGLSSTLTARDLGSIMSAWEQASGATVGESQASRD